MGEARLGYVDSGTGDHNWFILGRAQVLELLKPAPSLEGLHFEFVQVYQGLSKIKGLRTPTGSDEIEFLDPEGWAAELGCPHQPESQLCARQGNQGSQEPAALGKPSTPTTPGHST